MDYEEGSDRERHPQPRSSTRLPRRTNKDEGGEVERVHNGGHLENVHIRTESQTKNLIGLIGSTMVLPRFFRLPF